ncbi:MAG: hypothetical protein HFJ43_04940 [Clostridia bacterium]|nr:hypothetical protein [Clostridia bacterium]
MKKGTISIMILTLLLFLLIILGIIAYIKLYVPSNYVMRIENTVDQKSNVVYIYENGKVILNNNGLNKHKLSMSKEDVQELLNELPNHQVTVKVYVVTNKDGKETYVENMFYTLVSEKLKVKNIFTEGI